MNASSHDLLHQYLVQLQGRGVTHVPLEPAAWASLGRPVAVPAAKAEKSIPALPPAPLAAPLGKAEGLALLAQKAASSPEIRALGSFRDVMVFATGSPEADLMFIGEAPGAEEERKKEPFVGPAGQLLTKIINAMGLKRSDVYISNICKYRPAMPGGSQGSKNRPPTKTEMDACLPYITGEIELIRPKMIVALGATAANGLGIEGAVGRLRQGLHEFHGTPVTVTYHPSYLLRCETNDGGGLREKRSVWEDMLRVMEQLGLPISDKQRAYFTKAIG